MADTYSDFAFAKLSADVAAGDVTIVVDDVTQLPSTIDGDFYLTISSTLVHPPTFEIVKLTNVDTDTKTLTVARGQDGTTAQAHSSGVFIKGALTSAMMRRVRSGQLATERVGGPQDSEVFGERYLSLATGRTYERAPFNAQFNGDQIVDNDHLLSLPTVVLDPRTNLTYQLGGLLDWIVLDGHFAGAQLDNQQYANPMSLTNNRAAAVLNVGSEDYIVQLQLTTGATVGGSDIRMIFSADPTGMGYELSLVPGSYPTLYAPDGTVVAQVGTVVAPTDQQGAVYLVVRDDVLHLWYDPANNGSTEYYSTTLTSGGSHVGFSSSVANSSEPGVSFSGFHSYYVASRYLPLNFGVGRFIGISSDGDDLTQVHYNGLPFVVEPLNAIGTFGTFTPPTSPNENQSAVYQSGAVNNVALLLWSWGGRTLDERVAISIPTDTTSSFGLWVRGTSDGQTGLWLQFTYGSDWRATLWTVVGGQPHTAITDTQTAIPLIADFDPGFVQDIAVRVVIEDDDLTVYTSNTLLDGVIDTPYLQVHLSNLSDLPGDSFGFMLRNAAALADTTLGVRGIGFSDMGVWGGVRPGNEPIYGFGPPGRVAPLGVIYIDLSDGPTAYLSAGFNPALGSQFGAPLSQWLRIDTYFSGGGGGSGLPALSDPTVRPYPTLHQVPGLAIIRVDGTDYNNSTTDITADYAFDHFLFEAANLPLVIDGSVSHFVPGTAGTWSQSGWSVLGGGALTSNGTVVTATTHGNLTGLIPTGSLATAIRTSPAGGDSDQYATILAGVSSGIFLFRLTDVASGTQAYFIALEIVPGSDEIIVHTVANGVSKEQRYLHCPLGTFPLSATIKIGVFGANAIIIDGNQNIIGLVPLPTGAPNNGSDVGVIVGSTGDAFARRAGTVAAFDSVAYYLDDYSGWYEIGTLKRAGGIIVDTNDVAKVIRAYAVGQDGGLSAVGPYAFLGTSLRGADSVIAYGSQATLTSGTNTGNAADTLPSKPVTYIEVIVQGQVLVIPAYNR